MMVFFPSMDLLFSPLLLCAPSRILSRTQLVSNSACMSVGLFSATQTEAVEALSRAGLRNPGEDSCLPSHKQWLFAVGAVTFLAECDLFSWMSTHGLETFCSLHRPVTCVLLVQLTWQ